MGLISLCGMASNSDVAIKAYCRYFPKVLCLRKDVTKCEACPYFKLVESSRG